MMTMPPLLAAPPSFDISTITLPEALTGPIYFSPDSGDFYFPMRTIIRRHNPITLANTDFTPTNYSAPLGTAGAVRIMRKSATRLLVSNRVDNTTLYCIEIDNANATIVSQAITVGNGLPAQAPAWMYDDVGDRLFAPCRTAGGAQTIGTYKPDNTGVTLSSPDFGPVTNCGKHGLALSVLQWASTTVSYLYKGTISAWETVASFGTNNAPTGRVPQQEMNTDGVLEYNGFYYYMVDNVAGGGDFIIKAEITTPSHTRTTVHAGLPNRNYFAGSLCAHSSRIFLKGASGAFCVLLESDLSVVYEEAATGGDGSSAGEIACDAGNQLVYAGNMGDTTIKRVSGIP